MILPFGPLENGRQLINRIFVMLGTGVVVMLLLTANGSFYWQYIYWPFLDGAMNVTNLINDATVSGLGSFGIADYTAQTVTNVSDPDAISDALALKLEDTVRNVTQTLNQGARIGWAMIESMHKYEFEWTKIVKAAKRLVQVVLLFSSGMILIALSFYASFVFLYVVIEVAIRWTFISVISPFIIAGFLFPQTRGLVQFGLRGMLESMMALILVTAVAALSSTIMANVVVNPIADGETRTQVIDFGDGTDSADFQEYLVQMQNAEVLAPTLITEPFWIMTMILMIVGGLMFKMPGVATYLVGSSIMSGVGTEMAQQAQSTAMKGGGAAVTGAKLGGANAKSAGLEVATALKKVFG